MEAPDLSKYPDIMTLDEVAEVLRVCRNTVYTANRQGRIPSIKVGGLYRVPKHKLMAMLSGV